MPRKKKSTNKELTNTTLEPSLSVSADDIASTGSNSHNHSPPPPNSVSHHSYKPSPFHDNSGKRQGFSSLESTVSSKEIRKDADFVERIARGEDGRIDLIYSAPIGKPRVHMSEDQRSRFIEIIVGGGGRNMAMDLVMVSREMLRNTLQDYPDFKEALERKEKIRVEQAEMNVFDSAVNHSSIPASFGYIRLAREKNKDRSELSLRRREVKTQEEFVKRQLGIQDQTGPDFKKLTNIELGEFERIHNLIKNQTPLNAMDAVTYSRLMSKAIGVDRAKLATDFINDRNRDASQGVIEANFSECDLDQDDGVEE